jgi:hypothetical protein
MALSRIIQRIVKLLRSSRCVFKSNAQLFHPASESVGIDSKDLGRPFGAADSSTGHLKCLADLPGC